MNVHTNPTFEARAKELVSRMTLEEKASQLRYDAPAVSRLGIPAYNWWNEALHGVARAGTATMFPQAIGMAAAFDPGAIAEMADIIATEGRAKYNMQAKLGDRDIYKGLTFWSPNVNIFRDPRWGRGHETYGEDPFLSARLGVAFVKALQADGENAPCLKAAACAKHYAVHSGPENLRHEFDAVVSAKDLWETYLPAFEALVTEGQVESVMGAYNRVLGEPCNGSKLLLRDILRGRWGFRGHVVSDCWAIKDFHVSHKVTKTAPESAALALKMGCDLNCGNIYLHILTAYQEGLVTEADITQAAERLMTTRFRLGLFDSDCPYDAIPYEKNDCGEHHRAALEAAKKSMVLLKNDGLLPLNLDRIKNIAVIGPNADSRAALTGNYHGTASRYVTLLEGIEDYTAGRARVYYSAGCHLYKNRTENLALEDDRISEARAAAMMSDVVVLCLGLDEFMEGEEPDEGNSEKAGDKADLELPAPQRRLLEAVAAVGKPTVLLLSTGSAMAIPFADRVCGAVVQTWYPGAQGGIAAAELLFGECSPSGKLPVTFYRSTDDLPDFCDYSMKNRTYRYFEHEPLYPFGFGLTYGTVVCSDLKLLSTPAADRPFEVSVTLENTGCCDTGEVVQCYIKDHDSRFAVPNHSLCAFQRVSLKRGESKSVVMSIPAAALTAVDEHGERYVDSRHFTLYAGLSQPDARSIALTGQAPLSVSITL